MSKDKRDVVNARRIRSQMKKTLLDDTFQIKSVLLEEISLRLAKGERITLRYDFANQELLIRSLREGKIANA